MKTKKSKPKRVRDEEELANLKGECSDYDCKKVKKFGDMPLSEYTLKGLTSQGYEEPTEIQRESIGLSLQGRDVLGAAKTGSGKTLAFIVPLLERLYKERWSRVDGLGALVITPTRELAYQIFEALRKVGSHHEFSAGLVIGGKDLKYESTRLSTCNIIICTPGRILQHMDENPQFNASSLQILILDEADRCLDLGFSETMNAILKNLPVNRQTLLFSATQTRSVKDLARLSLKNPAFISVHEHSQYSTPDKLAQNYMICDLEKKMDILWSFIKNHRKAKTLIFVQSCKQVRYLQELYKRLRAGVMVLGLYGTLHQLKRMSIYETFCKKSDSVILIATDIAARGLDFPKVDWVFQMDCPEDAKTYLHRVGRTARHFTVGKSLLLLTPSEEEGMLKQLSAHKVPIEEIEANPSKLTTVRLKIEANLAGDTELKEMAQRAFQSYIKSIYLMKNKVVFDVYKLELESYARSLGLVVTPRVRFLQRQIKKREQTTQKEVSFSTVVDSDDEDDGILTIKRKNHELECEEEVPECDILKEDPNLNNKKQKVITKASVAKKMFKKKISANTVVKFDDEGEAKLDPTTQKLSTLGKDYEQSLENERGGIDVELAKEVLKAEDHFDKKREKVKIKERQKEEKQKLKDLKNKRKKTEKTTEAEEFSDEEFSDGPSLDWLPDPDAIYSEQSSDDDDKSNSDADTNERVSNISGKRKWKPPKKEKSKSNKKQRKNKEEFVISNLADDEDLALQLLGRG